MSIHSTGLSNCEGTDVETGVGGARAPPPLVTDIPGARAMLACGHDKIYDLIKANEIESYLDGRSRKIVIASIRAYVARKAAAAKQFEPARHPRSNAA
jgi:excisionase family DNA binding protein